MSFLPSTELYNFELESEEDEETIIAKRRQQRQAIVMKYHTPASIGAQSVQSSTENSDSEGSDVVERRATDDLERDITTLATSQTTDALHALKTMAKPSKEGGTPTTEKKGEAPNGMDMFSAGDMFAEHYQVGSES